MPASFPPCIRLNTSSLTSRSIGSRSVVLVITSHPAFSAFCLRSATRLPISTIPGRPQCSTTRWFPGFIAWGTTYRSQWSSWEAEFQV